MRRFDLVVVGTGAAASTAAHACRDAGWSVAVVDERPFGGTCALRGCDPKKVLVGAATAVDAARRLRGRGVVGDAKIAWRDLVAFKRSFTEPVPAARERALGETGVAAFHGTARFVSPEAVEVAGERLEAGRILLASGSTPRALRIPGEEHVVTSDAFLDLDELPPRVVFVGGGFISFEFACVARRAGAEATILHSEARPLEGFEPDLVDRLVARLGEDGIRVETERTVERVERADGEFVVHAGDARFEADLVVHGAGRIPNLAHLDLARGNVAAGKQGVEVDEFLQSRTNPVVYAAGDCAASGAPQLTPVASIEGKVAAKNMLGGNHARPDYAGVASVVYTEPPLARVGMLEEEARAAGLDFETHAADTSEWFSARRLGETASAHKLLVERGTRRVLGAHLLGPASEEVVNLFALAIRRGLSVEDVTDVPYAYPTRSSDLAYFL